MNYVATPVLTVHLIFYTVASNTHMSTLIVPSFNSRSANIDNFLCSCYCSSAIKYSNYLHRICAVCSATVVHGTTDLNNHLGGTNLTALCSALCGEISSQTLKVRQGVVFSLYMSTQLY